MEINSECLCALFRGKSRATAGWVYNIACQKGVVVRLLSAFLLLVASPFVAAQTYSYRVTSQTCSSSIKDACQGRIFESVSFEIQSPDTVVYQKVGDKIEGANYVMSNRNQSSGEVITALAFEPNLRYLNFSGSHDIGAKSPAFVKARLSLTVVFYKLSDSTAILQDTTSMVFEDGSASNVTSIVQLEQIQ